MLSLPLLLIVYNSHRSNFTAYRGVAAVEGGRGGQNEGCPSWISIKSFFSRKRFKILLKFEKNRAGKKQNVAQERRKVFLVPRRKNSLLHLVVENTYSPKEEKTFEKHLLKIPTLVEMTCKQHVREKTFLIGILYK